MKSKDDATLAVVSAIMLFGLMVFFLAGWVLTVIR